MSRYRSIEKIMGTIKNSASDFVEGFRSDYGIGREDNARMMYLMREKQGLQPEAPRFTAMTSSHAPTYRTREALGIASPEGVSAREEMDMGMMDTPGKRFGQRVGTVAADLTQDGTRNFWWLMNAAQAAAQVGTEAVLTAANPKLYGKSTVINNLTNEPLKTSSYRQAKEQGIINKQGKPRRGVSVKGEGKNAYYEKRNFQPGHVAALAIPTGIAINTGLGLMTPFGGAEGYKAAIPSEDDPTKTANVVGEVGLKYFMGRTGQLLPYDEFVKVRPDVSPEEYGKYKAFKYDKREDWNPLDGDTTMLAGALKTTTEGIHGPEVQFLGKSLPVTTGIVPYIGALAGGALGVRSKKNTIGRGFMGGLGGLAAGQVVGNALEQERRRRNAEDNEREMYIS